MQLDEKENFNKPANSRENLAITREDKNEETPSDKQR